MKKTKKMMIFGTVVALLAFFASCSKPAEKVQGTLKGYTLTSCQFFQNMFTNNETVEIVPTGNDLVNIKFTSEKWGAFLIKDATVTKSGKAYNISGKGTCRMAAMGGETNSYDCNLNANFVNLKNAEITFEVPAVMGGTKIIFHAGDAPAEHLETEQN